ncbi:MAG: fluoride efflux transporter CrcB [Blastocatellia bacterium]
MTRYLVVAFGGALGAIARYWFSSLIGERFPTRFPLGTLIINVTGSFIIGFFLTLVTERLNIHPNWRLGVAVGFVGAYTTFSTFEYETFRLLETGGGIGGFMNVIVSLMLGFLAVWGGIALAREISAPAIVGEKIISRGIKWVPSTPTSASTQDGPVEQELLQVQDQAAQPIRQPGSHD